MSRPPEKPTSRVRLESVWREARELVWQRRGRLAFGLVVLTIGRLSGLVVPASSKLLIDEVIGQQNVELLSTLALAAAAATLIQVVSSFTLAQLLSVAAQQAIVDLKQQLQQHVIRLPVSTFDQTKVGELLSRILGDAEGIRTLVGTGLVQLVGGLLTAGFAFLALLFLNWRLTIVTVAVISLFTAIVVFSFIKLRPLFRERSELGAEISGRLAETLGGIRIVKAYTAEAREDSLFAANTQRLFQILARTIRGVSLVTACSTLALGGLSITLMVMGGQAILAGHMSLGDFVSYIFFTGLMIAPLLQVSAVATQLAEAFAGLDRIRGILRLPQEQPADQTMIEVDSLDGEVEFERVCFEYTPGVPVLHDISFSVPAGSTVALVGSSGSGKSTVINLVMGFVQPISGRIRIDGNDLGSLDLPSYRSHLAVVLQDNFLFDGTIRENIVYSDPMASDDQVLAASRTAHCDDFVDPLPDGYATVIGERGIKVSGGQRQRIAIARAIVADPTILILDEATSSLDSESERKIKDGLDQLRKGRTTFVIAHRLSTVKEADLILVLDHGRICQQGSHRDLLARDGRYQELYRAQAELEHDRFINPGEDPLASSASSASTRTDSSSSETEPPPLDTGSFTWSQ